MSSMASRASFEMQPGMEHDVGTWLSSLVMPSHQLRRSVIAVLPVLNLVYLADRLAVLACQRGEVAHGLACIYLLREPCTQRDELREPSLAHGHLD